MSNSLDLQDCARCHGAFALEIEEHGSDWRVWCSNCGQAQPPKLAPSESEAVIQWNKAQADAAAAGPQPRYRPQTLDQCFGYLVEECGEVLAAAGKTIRWGLDSVNPEIPEEDRETNREWLLRECADLEVAIAMVRDRIAE